MKKQSYLEKLLLDLLRAAGLPAPVTQYQALAPKRKFAWDAAYPDARILIEVQGSTYRPVTGHTSGSGLHRDYEKNNLAVKAGWHCLYFDKRMLKSGEAVEIIREMLESEEE